MGNAWNMKAKGFQFKHFCGENVKLKDLNSPQGSKETRLSPVNLRWALNSKPTDTLCFPELKTHRLLVFPWAQADWHVVILLYSNAVASFHVQTPMSVRGVKCKSLLTQTDVVSFPSITHERHTGLYLMNTWQHFKLYAASQQRVKLNCNFYYYCTGIQRLTYLVTIGGNL